MECWRHMFQPAAQGADGETEARGSTIVAFRAATEARLGKGLGLGWPDIMGPFPRKSTTLFH